jgi:hypothetical protein
VVYPQSELLVGSSGLTSCPGGRDKAEEWPWNGLVEQPFGCLARAQAFGSVVAGEFEHPPAWAEKRTGEFVPFQPTRKIVIGCSH